MKTALETIEELNDSLYKQFGDNNCHSFSFTTSGFVESFSLYVNLSYSNCELHLWNSENSNRKWNEKTNEYEEYKKTFVRELDNLIKELQIIKKSIK